MGLRASPATVRQSHRRRPPALPGASPGWPPPTTISLVDRCCCSAFSSACAAAGNTPALATTSWPLIARATPATSSTSATIHVSGPVSAGMRATSRVNAVTRCPRLNASARTHRPMVPVAPKMPMSTMYSFTSWHKGCAVGFDEVFDGCRACAAYPGHDVVGAREHPVLIVDRDVLQMLDEMSGISLLDAELSEFAEFDGFVGDD